jgi:hypothetical protein
MSHKKEFIKILIIIRGAFVRADADLKNRLRANKRTPLKTLPRTGLEPVQVYPTCPSNMRVYQIPPPGRYAKCMYKLDAIMSTIKIICWSILLFAQKRREAVARRLFPSVPVCGLDIFSDFSHHQNTFIGVLPDRCFS